MKIMHFKNGPTPGDDFEMRLFVLTRQVSYARLHLKYARELAKAASDRPHVLEYAETFFALTYRAHLESAYGNAARLFDPTRGPVTIRSIVRMADQKAGKFQSVTAGDVREKINLWESQIASIEPLLSKLQDLRNGLMAHLDGNVILNEQKMSRTIGVTFDEIERILNIAKDILSSALEAYN